MEMSRMNVESAPRKHSRFNCNRACGGSAISRCAVQTTRPFQIDRERLNPTLQITLEETKVARTKTTGRISTGREGLELLEGGITTVVTRAAMWRHSSVRYVQPSLLYYDGLWGHASARQLDRDHFLITEKGQANTMDTWHSRPIQIRLVIPVLEQSWKMRRPFPIAKLDEH